MTLPVTNCRRGKRALATTANARWNKKRSGESAHFFVPQSQLLPQLHSLPSFIGQFLPVFLQLGFSAANADVQIIAARIDIRIFV
jgi:hypothetical protein